jgi:PAS domain S-box-containing protein
LTVTLEANSYHALIFAPRGRDAAIAKGLLDEIGVTSVICADCASFQTSFDEDVCFAIIAEEALQSANLRAIAAWIAAQPSWSDLPFIVLTQRGGGSDRNPAAARLSEVLNNVTFLERPFHPTTFASVARTALKGRQRQYEARARIDELHEGEQRLRTALLAGRLGSWELDLTSGALTCSATHKAIFGLTAEAPLSFEDLVAKIHLEDRTRMLEAVQRSIETGSDYVIEYRNVWPDGSTHWAEVRARPVYDRNGHQGRLVGVSSDITARKGAEANLLQLNELLEARVALRTAELETAHASVLDEIRQREKAEEQLRQVQKMETIGQISGGVAHDFNNLLMAILGNLELLRKCVPDTPKAARFIDGALQGAKRGAALTQRLLAFARQQDLKVEPVDLIALVLGMTELLERSVGPGIELALDLPEALPSALVDANQVEMALLNLAVNGRDAMPDGGKLSITLDLAKTSAGEDLSRGNYLRLTVIDTGHGMDSTTLQRAIDPFFSTKELGKGTGLGLSMIHGLAVQLNGALRLSSTPGLGTRAELWLPATSAKVELKDDPLESSTEASPRARVLVVDDDALVSTSTVGMLEDLGHEVIAASSGASAVDILQSGRQIDLLITDYCMPGMTGVQLAKAAQELQPGLPILLATGYADLPKVAEVGLPRLHKPYQRDQLAQEIARILQPKRAPVGQS